MNARYKAGEKAAKLLTAAMPVIYTDDAGNRRQRKTSSEPWPIGHGQWVIKLEGFSGGFDCARVVPDVTATNPKE